MDTNQFEIFNTNVVKVFAEFLELKVNKEGDLTEEKEDLVSLGISSIISFTGKANGRVMLDVEPQLALLLANHLTGENFTNVKDPLVLASVSELNNMITGNSVVDLNNSYDLDLWLAPPIVMAGTNMIIALPKLKSYSYGFDSGKGKVRYNIAFKGGGIS
jgi:chemotaxis protein CheX